MFLDQKSGIAASRLGLDYEKPRGLTLTQTAIRNVYANETQCCANIIYKFRFAQPWLYTQSRFANYTGQ